jgi:hypothetical protein
LYEQILYNLRILSKKLAAKSFHTTYLGRDPESDALVSWIQEPVFLILEILARIRIRILGSVPKSKDQDPTFIRPNIPVPVMLK